MVSIFIKKMVILFYSSFAGMLVGGTAITGLVAWMNFTSRDGPLFPPSLVALALLIPVMMILLLIEAGVLGYELISKEDLDRELFAFGIVGGVFTGILMHEILITPFQDVLNLLRLLIFLGLGMTIGLTLFGTHWLGNLVCNKLDPTNTSGEKGEHDNE